MSVITYLLISLFMVYLDTTNNNTIENWMVWLLVKIQKVVERNWLLP